MERHFSIIISISSLHNRVSSDRSKNSSEALRFERHFPSQLQQNILHGPVAWHPKSKAPLPRAQHKASEPLGCNSMTIAMMKAARIALFILVVDVLEDIEAV